MTTIQVATVVGPEGVRLLTAAESESQLLERIAEYVGQNAELLLWPEDAHTVRVLLAERRNDEAVRRYFAVVGNRWESEDLTTSVVTDDDDGPSVPSTLALAEFHILLPRGAGPVQDSAATRRRPGQSAARRSIRSR